MAVEHALVSVGTSATKVSSADTARDAGAYAQSVTVQSPTGAADVYLGGVGVATGSYGFVLKAGVALNVDLQGSDELYAVVASDTVIVACLYQGV